MRNNLKLLAVPGSSKRANQRAVLLWASWALRTLKKFPLARWFLRELLRAIDTRDLVK